MTEGSVLGPLLFLIYVQHLPQWVTNSITLMFADDTIVSISWPQFCHKTVDQDIETGRWYIITMGSV